MLVTKLYKDGLNYTLDMTTKTPNSMKLKVKPLFHTQITYDNEHRKPMILLRNPLFHTQNYTTPMTTNALTS